MSSDKGCDQHGRGTPIASFAYTDQEKAVLAIARHYFTSFAAPQCHGWISGISCALCVFGDRRGPEIAVAVLSAVQAMRRARRSTFCFNSPDCDTCAAHVTPHEQTLMSALRATAGQRREAAQGHAALLCEGNPVAPLLRALETLADRALQPNWPQSSVVPLGAAGVKSRAGSM
ncbi:MAG: hypothetical protein AAGD12_10330 [Pseudomonadota bacterium]